MSDGRALPTTLAQWERALVDRFLRVGEGADASPLRSLEITGDTLAAALPRSGASGDEAAEAFRTAIRSDPRVFAALRVGSPRPPSETSPNCFAYLCASLLIDTLLDGAYSAQGQYRERLRTWLGTHRTMMHLSGIASMWRDLARWLDERVEAGGDYRRLVLPDPRNWTHIGHTRRLSFPTRSDLRFLERTLASFPRGLSDPPGLVRALDAAIGRDGASWGMEGAFVEFRDAFRGGGASTDHRFWRLVLRAAASRAGGVEASPTRLEIEFDEDGRHELRLDAAPVANLGSAMRAPPVSRSANLGRATQRGIVFFRQVGMARWSAEAEPPPGHARVGLAPGHASIARGLAVGLTASGDWLLTAEAMPPRAVDDLLVRLRLTRLRGERLIDITVEGGIHTGAGLLGRLTFLPRIVSTGRTSAIRALAGEGSSPPPARCVDGEIVADSALEGRYELSVSSGRPDDVPEWTRRVRFQRNARPHGELGQAAERNPAIMEWTGDRDDASSGGAPRRGTWEETPTSLADLLEAVYASGRSGLGDADIFDLVSRAGAGAAVWDVLRAVQESGFVIARQRARWRGRIWTLAAPHLVASDGGVLVGGATCAALQKEFREVASAAGGSPFRRASRSLWSPPLIGAADVEATALAGVLGWPVAVAQGSSQWPGAIETSTLLAEDHMPASAWNWRMRRFVTGTIASDHAVSITRWVHPGGRDHDQYRVRSGAGETRHATRTAAILQGHIVARSPLFELRDGLIVRTAAEGALPLEIAAWLRVQTGSGGGPTEGGGYAYPVADARLRGIAAALPGCIEGLPDFHEEPGSGAERAAAIVRARRSGGRTRLRWADGGVMAA